MLTYGPELGCYDGDPLPARISVNAHHHLADTAVSFPKVTMICMEKIFEHVVGIDIPQKNLEKIID